ncbi:MAG: hypothetical protein ACE5GX_17695 [Thermoanaerobaculia bacterium]
MRHALRVLLSLTLLVSVPPPAAAEICAIDTVPAATLLLPYFAVDLSKLTKPKRTETTTLVLQTSYNDGPIVARVTLWTDLGVPTLAFDVYLERYASRKIALHDLFRGRLPASPELDPGCAAWGLVDKTDLQNAHRGRPVDGYGGRCASRLIDGKIARGYVTIDVINSDRQCGNLFPSDPGYFASGGNGVASNTNALVGWVNNDNRRVKYGQIEPLVHIEAVPVPGSYTFYGRYVQYNGADGREPLGTTWDAVFNVRRGARTDLEVWRDSGAVQGPFECDQLGVQGWYPLDEVQVVALDRQGFPLSASVPNGAIEVCEANSSGPVFCFPAETGSYRFDTGPLSVPFGEGWVFLNLNRAGISQSYVSVRQTLGSGKRRGRSQAASLSHACGQSPPAAGDPIP